MNETNTQKLAAKAKAALLLLLLGLISITTATYAWFTITSAGKVNEMSMQVTTGDKLGISTHYSTNLDDYQNEITTEAVNAALGAALGYTKGTADIALAPLTSGNGVRLYTRGVNTFAGALPEGAGPSDPAKQKDHLELTLWFMSSSEMYVYLTAENSNPATADGTSVRSDGTKNNALQAHVADAARLSFTVYTDGAGNTQDTAGGVLIYEPVKQGAVTLEGRAAADAGTATQPTFTLNDTEKDALLFKLEPEQPRRVVVRLWLEGEDEQCVNTDTVNIEKAWLNATLRFVGKDKNGIALS